LLSACGGSNATTVSDAIEQALTQPEGAEQSCAGALTQAQATVSARSLRVRSEPSANGAVIGGIKEGEVYDVVGLSSDGEWVQLAIPAIDGGEGWVSANFVSVQGSITDAEITDAAVAAPVAATGSTPAATGESLNLIAVAPGTATVQTEGVRLRVRAQPSANAEIVGYVYDGEVYPVVDTADDGAWVQIGGRIGTDNINGGWVASEFLVMN